MEISNEELFNSALSDEPTEITADEPVNDGQPRDEHGRFAEKAAEAETPVEAKPAEKQVTDEAQIPSWRLRELREERDALRHQLAQFQSRPQQPVAPAPRPDIFENPDGFVKAGVSEAVDPIKAEINGIKEQFSLMYAIDKHGEDKVNEAYKALHNAAVGGDAEANAVVSRVKQSMNPYGEIIKWHEKQSIYSQIGGDPQKWFDKQLEERLADDKFKSDLAAKLQPAASDKPKPVFQVPPSLNRVASAAAALEEAGDLSDESLFKHALG